MHRRTFLSTAAAAPLILAATRTRAVDASLQPHNLGLVIHSYAVRRWRPLPPEFSSIADPLAFVEHAATLGAPGVQTNVAAAESPAQAAKLREALERHAMYVEGIVNLPKNEADAARFEADAVASKQAGASILRTVCMTGRRYETLESAEQFRAFAEQSWRSLRLAEPIAAKHGVKLAVENHKDWRTDEMVAWLRRLGSEHVGVCLDTGNSIALMEEPHAVVEALAPWTLTTHLKDMAVAEYDEGFLLAEVPLGDGFLDLPKVAATIRKARPDVRLNLEMITRDPLRVPCLTAKFWAALASVPAADLAAMLALVRRKQRQKPLPSIGTRSHVDQLRAEAENIARSIDYARRRLLPASDS